MDITIPASVTQSLGIDKPSGPLVPEPKAEVPEAPKPAPDDKSEPKEEETPKLTAAEKRMLKIKADGEEFEFDASDDEAIRQAVAKARGADKRFQSAAEMRKEAGEMRKQAEDFILRLQKDPVSVLSDPRLGVDFKKIAEDFVWQQIQEQQLTPEQKQARDVQRELERYRAQEASAKADSEAKEVSALQTHYEASYEKTIITALESGGIPNTAAAIRRMAGYLELAIEQGLDLEPSDLVAQVKKDLQEEHRALYDKADDSRLLEMLGEPLAKKLRQADLKRLKTTQPEANRRPAPAQRQQRDQPIKKLSGDEWREDLQRRLLGR